MEPDLERMLRILNDHRVEFVLIGGLAAVFHGSPFPTEDVDITPAGDAANLARLSDALRELHARIRTEDAPGGLPFAHDAASLAAGTTWNLVTDAGDLDVALQPDGTRGHADLARDAEAAVLHDQAVSVASLADVVRSKQAANRPKDQRVLPTLRRILEDRDR